MAKQNKKPCAACGRRHKSADGGWIVASGGAKWLAKDNVVRKYFSDPPGFYVDVPVPPHATEIWTSKVLTPAFRSPQPARRAYTGSGTGTHLQQIVGVAGVPAKSRLRLRAPIPYFDSDGHVYPPHAHCRLTTGRTLTLPFLVPECGYTTALRVARQRKPWRVIYVLDNLDRYSAPPLPRTEVHTSAAAIARAVRRRATPSFFTPPDGCKASRRIADTLCASTASPL